MVRGQETKEQRKANRQGLNLRESLVTPQLLKRYQFALIQVTQFLADCNIQVRYIDELDDAVSTWVEHIFLKVKAKVWPVTRWRVSSIIYFKLWGICV